MTLSTTPAQGMGPNYHWLHGQSQTNLLHCTEAEARKLAAVDELLEALHVVRRSVGWSVMSDAAKSLVEAAIAKATGGQP